MTVSSPAVDILHTIIYFAPFHLFCLQRSKEKLEELFSQFGEVTSIYYPMDLKSRTFRGFAFVRYGNRRQAELAAKEMHDANLGVGRNIQVAIVTAKTYISQDESDSQYVAKYA